MLTPPDMIVLITGALILGCLLSARWSAAQRSERRVTQLREAVELLRQHASCLELFLTAQAAPDELKAALINVNDTMADRDMALQTVKMVTGEQRMLSQEPSPAIDALMNAFGQLNRSRPDLAEAFTLAVLTAVCSGFLRWPETALRFEAATVGIVQDPRRKAAIVTAEAVRLQTGVPFGLHPYAPAASAV
jgi:hypothetical protein